MRLQDDVIRLTKKLEDLKANHVSNIQAAVTRAKDTLELKEKQIKEAEDDHRQKQKQFIAQNKKLVQERDEAVKAKDAIQVQCGDKMNKFDDIINDMSAQIQERSIEIGTSFIIQLFSNLIICCSRTHCRKRQFKRNNFQSNVRKAKGNP